MRRMLERSVEVNADAATTWNHLIEPERWPSWAHHIRRVDMDPAGPAQLGSKGRVRLKNGTSARQEVVELNEGRNWRWDGRFLWLGLVYDHIIEARPDGGTRITFTIEGTGLGVGSIGRIFAWVYARNLDQAMPNLAAELAQNSSSA